RVADRDDLAGRGRDAVALLAHALGLALEDRADGDGRALVAAERLDDLLGDRLGDQLTLAGELAAALGLDLGGGEAPDEVRVRIAVAEHRQVDVLGGAAVLGADDDVLRDVDETAGQVAR